MCASIYIDAIVTQGLGTSSHGPFPTERDVAMVSTSVGCRGKKFLPRFIGSSGRRGAKTIRGRSWGFIGEYRAAVAGNRQGKATSVPKGATRP